MIIDTHLHVWSDDSERYPFAEGRAQVGGGSVGIAQPDYGRGRGR